MGDPGDGPARPRVRGGGGGGESHTAWDQFLTHALQTRLDPDRFADFVPLLSARHPLGPGPVADLFLRPSPWNTYTLDPRMPLYLQTLLDLRLVDMQAVLAGLFRYSTAHTVVGGGKNGEQGGVGAAAKERGVKGEPGDEGEGKGVEDVKTKKEVVRWQSSFTSEEVIFYRLTKAVGSGSAMRNSKDALEVCVMMARWMMLFTVASAALPPEHDEDVIMGGIAGAGSATKKSRDDMENSRAAFVMLLLGVCENPIVLQALTKSLAKSQLPPPPKVALCFAPGNSVMLTMDDPGARKALSQSLANFVPSIMQGASQGTNQGTAQIAARLELFRTDTLAGFEPIDKKKEAANAEMNELLDETLGLQNIVLPHLDIRCSRAGLYIYLNAAVSPFRPIKISLAIR